MTLDISLETWTVEDPSEPTKKEKLISGGWTFFHPFNPSQGGLDPVRTWKEDDDENNQEDDAEIDEAAKT
jgi:hypothetical protein